MASVYTDNSVIMRSEVFFFKCCSIATGKFPTMIIIYLFLIFIQFVNVPHYSSSTRKISPLLISSINLRNILPMKLRKLRNQISRVSIYCLFITKPENKIQLPTIYGRKPFSEIGVANHKVYLIFYYIISLPIKDFVNFGFFVRYAVQISFLLRGEFQRKFVI
jgi:hypothetical protein